MGSGGITIPGIAQEASRHFMLWFSGRAHIHSQGGLDLEGLEVSDSVTLMFFTSDLLVQLRELEGGTANWTHAFSYKERIREKSDHCLYTKSSLTLKLMCLKLKTGSLVSFGCSNSVGLHLLGALGLFCQLSLAVYLPRCFQNLFQQLLK